MLKSVLLAITILSLNAQAQASCLGEAQIIAKIASIQSDSLSTCKAYIDLTAVRIYNESMVCPLDLSEVHSKGVEVGFVDGHDCRLQSGDELNGTLVKINDELIVLE